MDTILSADGYTLPTARELGPFWCGTAGVAAANFNWGTDILLIKSDEFEWLASLGLAGKKTA